MKNFKFPISEFSRNVITLLTGATIAQAIPIALTPVLTRIYTPEEFGVFALFSSLTAMLAVIITGRYEMAIMLPAEEEEATNVLVIGLIITTSLSIILSVLIFLFKTQISLFFENADLEKWLYWIPLSVFFLGIYQCLNYWSNRNKNYSDISISKVAQSTGAIATKIGFGYSHFGASGLVYGEIFGQGLSSLILSLKNRYILRNLHRVATVEKLKFVSKKYYNFPRVNLPHSFLNVFSSRIPVLIINSYFTSTVTGFYALANKIVMLPLNLFTSSYSQVFYEEISSSINRKNSTEVVALFKHTLSRLLLYSLPFFILIFIFSKPMFALVFGEVWAEAGRYMMILVPMLYFRFSGTIVSSVVLAYNRQEKALVIEVINTILRILSLVTGGLTSNIILGLILYSASSTIITIYRLLWYWSIVKEA